MRPVGSSELKKISKIARARQRHARGSGAWGSYGGAACGTAGGIPVYSEDAFKTIDFSACLLGDKTDGARLEEAEKDGVKEEKFSKGTSQVNLLIKEVEKV